MAAAALAGVAVPAASADHGVLDPSFGDGGRVTSDFDTVAFAAGVAVGPDGSVFAGGSYGEANLMAFAVTKWRADGSPDPTFGDNGQVHLQPASSPGAANGVALSPDGKVVLAGATDEMVVMRLDADGKPDQTFGNDGEVDVAFGTNPLAGAAALTVLSDGSIVVAGSTGTSPNPTDNTMAVARISSAGDVLWKTTTAFGTSPSSATAIVSDAPAPTVTVAGSVIADDGTRDFALARYRVDDGSLDPSFGTDGLVTTAFANASAEGHAIARTADGRLLVAGDLFLQQSSNTPFGLARYTDEGKLDEAFGDGGKVVGSAPEGNTFANAVVSTSCGTAVVGGVTFDTSAGHQEFTLTGYDAAGHLDGDFGTAGRTLTPFDDKDAFGSALAVAPSGALVMAGGITGQGNRQMGAARYTDACAPPPPTDKDQCKNGGWKNFGTRFKNQGQCVRFVNTGK